MHHYYSIRYRVESGLLEDRTILRGCEIIAVAHPDELKAKISNLREAAFLECQEANYNSEYLSFFIVGIDHLGAHAPK